MSEKKYETENEEVNNESDAEAENIMEEVGDALSDDEEESLTLSSFIFEWSNALFVALIIVLLTLTFFVRHVNVNGSSMRETLQDKDKLLLTNFLYQPTNGDIVVVTHGAHYKDLIIKRVVATEGQKLSIDYDTGSVSVDGVRLDEKYIIGTTIMLPDPLDIPEKIPEGYVFVMGDNREGSLDSRSNEIGLIPVNNIIGKAIWRFYPWDRFGSIYDNI